jgi:hypothetical protein
MYIIPSLPIKHLSLHYAIVPLWMTSPIELPFCTRNRRMTDSANSMAGAEGALPEVLFPAPETDNAGEGRERLHFPPQTFINFIRDHDDFPGGNITAWCFDTCDCSDSHSHTPLGSSLERSISASVFSQRCSFLPKMLTFFS